jgi:hypothetical protein
MVPEYCVLRCVLLGAGVIWSVCACDPDEEQDDDELDEDELLGEYLFVPDRAIRTLPFPRK